MLFITFRFQGSGEMHALEALLNIDISDPFSGVVYGDHGFEEVDSAVLSLLIARLDKRNMIFSERKMHRGF